MQFNDIPPPPYYVPDPEIPEVLNLSDGSYQTLAEVVGDVYGDAVKKRLEIKDAIAAGVPLYACAECGVPVNLLSRLDTRRFHFKHTSPLAPAQCAPMVSRLTLVTFGRGVIEPSPPSFVYTVFIPQMNL